MSTKGSRDVSSEQKSIKDVVGELALQVVDAIYDYRGSVGFAVGFIVAMLLFSMVFGYEIESILRSDRGLEVCRQLLSESK